LQKSLVTLLNYLELQKKVENEVELRVHPVLIKKSQMIAKVDGVMNGVSVVGDMVGETMYYGPGAGGDATASAVVSNLVDIARSGKSSPMLGFKKSLESGLTLAKKESITSKYYIRINVKDEVGVLAKITNILSQNGISIQTVLQKSLDNSANLLLSTHTCLEKDIQKSMNEIENLDITIQKPAMIRMED
jgi:homoserine dehydrogenase